MVNQLEICFLGTSTRLARTPRTSTFSRPGSSFARRSNPLPYGAALAHCHPRSIRASERLVPLSDRIRFAQHQKQSCTPDRRSPRKMPSTKRPGEAEDGSESPNKFARTDTGLQHGHEQQHLSIQQQQQQQQTTEYGQSDYGSNNSSSKKRGGGGGGGGASTRTGQACDRCKVRTKRPLRSVPPRGPI